MPFTLAQIEAAHEKVKTGAEFPAYIRDLISLGVRSFETRVTDSRTQYKGDNDYTISSEPKYGDLTVSDTSDKASFENYLKIHQKGETDYYTFCQHCAETGIVNWMVDLDKLTCTYYDKAGNIMLTEMVPA